MKKATLLSLFLLVSMTTLFAQFGEFQYFVIRAGANHNYIYFQPDKSTDRFMKTPYGEMPMVADNEVNNAPIYQSYGPGFVFDLYFHFDFKSDKSGIVLGAEYGSNQVAAQYFSQNMDYSMVEQFRVHSVSVPLFIKFSDEIFDRQKYGFIGVKYHHHLKLKHKQTVQWDEISSKEFVTWEDTDMLADYNLEFFAGFNYSIFNFEVSYMPQPFLNKDYVVNETYTPLADQKGNIISLKTCISIPLNEWTSTQNWVLQKLFRKLSFKRRRRR